MADNVAPVHDARPESVRMTVTSAERVVALFTSAPRAFAVYQRWRNDPRYVDVVPRVLEHVSEFVYKIAPSDVWRIREATHHPLGTLEKRVVSQCVDLERWNTPFTMAYVLHHYIETRRAIPTWAQFKDYIFHHPEGRLLLGDSVREIVGNDGLRAAAAQWRIGLQYQSAIRELYVVSALRSMSFDMEVHPLADALFRVDAWLDRTVFAIYIENSKYRNGFSGRKPRTFDILANSSPAFQVRDIRLAVPTEYGKIALPSRGQLIELAGALR